MKTIVFAAATLALASFAAPRAEAAGCLSGAAVGGVAGHVAGHHGVLGAAAGCAVGHHMANRDRARDQHARSNGNPGPSDTTNGGH
jgi:hypothetical protein